jgi:hypothetical protein
LYPLFLLASKVLTAVVMKSSVFWDVMPLQQNMALPSSGLKNKAHKKPA